MATKLLQDDTWDGFGEVPVLGPEDHSQHDPASITSDVLSRPVRYEPTPPEASKQAMIGRGFSEAMAQGWPDMALAENDGLDSRRSDQRASSGSS